MDYVLLKDEAKLKKMLAKTQHKQQFWMKQKIEIELA